MAQYITKVIDSIIKGTTFEGISFLITKNGLPLSIESAKMELKFSENAPATLTLINGDGLTLDELSPGLVVVDKQIIDIDALNYLYEIETTTTEGDVYVYIKGTWEIIN